MEAIWIRCGRNIYGDATLLLCARLLEPFGQRNRFVLFPPSIEEEEAFTEVDTRYQKEEPTT